MKKVSSTPEDKTGKAKGTARCPKCGQFISSHGNACNQPFTKVWTREWRR